MLFIFFFFHTLQSAYIVSPTMRRQHLVQFRSFCRWSLLTRFHFPHVYGSVVTFQPVNSLLSWFIATE